MLGFRIISPNAMDDDLWGPPSAAFVTDEDDICCMQSVRGRCEFYFDYRVDVIEENAMNERSCVQALRILIKKEDAEIDELERVLVLLQNELACAEHDDWADKWCNVVRKKVDLLNECLTTLKNGDVEDSEIQSLLHRGPADRLHTVLKALLENCCRARDKLVCAEGINEQICDATPFGSNIGSTQSALDEDATTSNVSDAETIENRDPFCGTEDGGPDAALKLQETVATNNSETLQPAGEAEDPEIQSLLHKGPADRLNIMLKALLESYFEAKVKPEQIRDAIPLDANIGSTQLPLDEDANTSNISDDETIENRDPCYGIGDRSPVTALKSQETKANDLKTVQAAGEADLTSTDGSRETVTKKRMTVAESESSIKSEEHSCLPIPTYKVLEPRTQTDHKELLKPTTTHTDGSATNVNRDNSRHLNEIQNSRVSNSSSHSKHGEHQYSSADSSKILSALRKGNCGSLALRSLVSKAKQKLKELTKAPAEKMDSSSFSLREGEEERWKDHHQAISFHDIQAATEPFTIEGLLEMCDEHGNNTNTGALHDKEHKVLQPGMGYLAGTTTAVNEEKLIPNLLSEPQRKKLETENNAELNSTSMESAVSIATKKRGYKNMGPNMSLNRNVKQKVTPPREKQGDAGEIGSNLGDSQKKPTKKTKKSGSKSKRESIIQNLSSPEIPKGIAQILSNSVLSISELKEMTANDLRVMAKALKVTHYYKLKKSDLVEQLTIRLSPSQPRKPIVQSGSYSISCFPQEYGETHAEL